MFEPNKYQKEAIDCKDSKIVCIAGAGAGKTATLVNRLIRMIEDGATPASILVLTFTRAAAFEMKERFLRATKSSSKFHRGIPDFRTFHAFCYSLVSTDEEVRNALGYKNIPVIGDEKVIKATEQKALQATGIKLSKQKLGGEQALTPKEQYEYNIYTKALKRMQVSDNLISFKDLLSSVCRLFTEDDPCIQKYKNLYKHIIVDEFQDTDKIQWNFVTSCNATIYVCGDALQALYGFRGATSEIIKNLTEDKDWTTLQLPVNYRSGEKIVEYANRLTNKYAGNKRYRNAMISNLPAGDVAIHSRSARIPGWKYLSDDEADYLRHVIAKHDESSNSVAILCRTNKEALAIQGLFDELNSPYETAGNSNEFNQILNSVRNSEYMMEWTSTFLNNEQYSQYIRNKELGKYTKEDGQGLNLLAYYEDMRDYSKVKYRLDTIFQIRSCLNLKNPKLPAVKCADILNLLGVRDVFVDYKGDAQPTCIVDYIFEILNKKVSHKYYIGTIHSVKGLEFDEVILLGVNDSHFMLINEDNWNVFYVGVTRAKKKLEVFGVELPKCS